MARQIATLKILAVYTIQMTISYAIKSYCLSDVLLFVQSYLAYHTVIALLFSYIPAFMTYWYVSKIPMTCSCSSTVACTLRTYSVLCI